MELLFAANTTLAGFVFYSSLKASVLIALVLLAQRMLVRQLSAKGHYLLWLAVVISLLTPVGFTTVIPRLPALSPPSTVPVKSADSGSGLTLPRLLVPESVRDRSMPSQGRVDAALPTQESASTSVTLRDVLPLAWLLGVLLFMGTVLVRHHRFARIVRAAVSADSSLQTLLDNCRQQIGCQRQVELLCSSDIDAPLVTGCFRSSLLLPVDIAGQLSPAQLRHVFLHELMHVSNYDIATNWGLTLLQALHWFNPLVWFGFNRLRQDRELVCDAATLTALACTEARDYGFTLLQLSQTRSRRPATVGALGIVDDHAQLRRRIVMIVQSSLPTRFQSLIAGVLLLLFGTMAFSMPTAEVPKEALKEVSIVVPAPVLAANVAEVPAIAASVPAVNTVASAVTEVVAPKPATSKRAVTANKAATANTVMVREAAVSERIEFASPATETAITVALAETDAPIAPAVEQPSVVTVIAKQETYQDWSAIQTLAKASGEARDPGVKSITEWNNEAEVCGVPLRKFARLDLNLSKPECRKIYASIKDIGQIYEFYWNRCSGFVRTYNRLVTSFVHAKDEQFVDRAAVKSELQKTYQTLGEFCSTDVYREKYPHMDILIRHAQNSMWGGSAVGSSYNGSSDYHSAYPNGMYPTENGLP